MLQVALLEMVLLSLVLSLVEQESPPQASWAELESGWPSALEEEEEDSPRRRRRYLEQLV